MQYDTVRLTSPKRHDVDIFSYCEFLSIDDDRQHRRP
jgi:hypothetical protein